MDVHALWDTWIWIDCSDTSFWFRVVASHITITVKEMGGSTYTVLDPNLQKFNADSYVKYFYIYDDNIDGSVMDTQKRFWSCSISKEGNLRFDSCQPFLSGVKPSPRKGSSHETVRRTAAGSGVEGIPDAVFLLGALEDDSILSISPKGSELLQPSPIGVDDCALDKGVGASVVFEFLSTEPTPSRSRSSNGSTVLF